MKARIKDKKFIVTEMMVHIEDCVSRKTTYFRTRKEAQDFYNSRKNEIEQEILSTGSFCGYDREGFDIEELENALDCDTVVLIFNKPQTESIFTMGIREEAC